MDKIFVFAVLCLARQAATTTAASYCYDVRGSDFSLACLFENCTAAGCEGATDCGVDTTADYSTVREAQLACETAKAIPGSYTNRLQPILATRCVAGIQKCWEMREGGGEKDGGGRGGEG